MLTDDDDLQSSLEIPIFSDSNIDSDEEHSKGAGMNKILQKLLLDFS